jgi:hypothetical protein
MKAILSMRNFLMITSIVAFVSSCSKDDTVGTQVTPSVTPSKPSVTFIGAITDMGPIATDLRLMQVEINKPGNLYEDVSGDFIASIDKIVMNFYSSSDGIIPSGSYSFSADDVKRPFTFDSGTVAMPAGLYKASIGNQISDGNVIVSQNGANYTFTFSCFLYTGELFSGTTSGNTSYQDSLAK